jgi:uncharacterized membrane protein YciS (DUF1049 family)
MAVRAESFFLMADSLFQIMSWVEMIGVLGLVLSWFIAFFKQSHAFLVHSGQLLP